MSLNRDGMLHQSHMTNLPSAFDDQNMLFRGSPLQLVRTSLAWILFATRQVTAICP